MIAHHNKNRRPPQRTGRQLRHRTVDVFNQLIPGAKRCMRLQSDVGRARRRIAQIRWHGNRQMRIERHPVNELWPRGILLQASPDPGGNICIARPQKSARAIRQSLLFKFLLKPKLLESQRAVPNQAIEHEPAHPMDGDAVVAQGQASPEGNSSSPTLGPESGNSQFHCRTTLGLLPRRSPHRTEPTPGKPDTWQAFLARDMARPSPSATTSPARLPMIPPSSQRCRATRHDILPRKSRRLS